MPMRAPTHRAPWQKPRAEAEAKRKAAIDASRPGSRLRGYDQHWKRLRALFLRANPTCQVIGCGRSANEVDHIETVDDRPDLRLTWSNLRALCKPCHSRRTAIDQGFARVTGPRL
jgi:5-methylcytosine-specific restriction enzyme A